MGADTPPDDVWPTGVDFASVLEGRPAVISPSHLPDSRMSLHTLYAEAGMEALFGLSKISDEPRNRIAEFPLLFRA